MKNIYEFQQEINKLVKSSDYSGALALFKTEKANFDAVDIASNGYLVCDMLKCLRMTNAHSAALKFISIYGIEVDATMEQGIVVALSLVLYDWYKKVNDIDASDNSKFKTIIDNLILVMPLLKRNKTPFAIDFYSTITQKVLKVETKRPNVNWSLIVKFCESIDSSHLQTNCHEYKVIKNGVEKMAEMASVKEEWFSVYSKSLYATERYQDCIKACDEALLSIKKMHYSNNVWFKRRMAQCFLKQGLVDKSIDIYESVIKQKDDWFILAELGSIYYGINKLDRALLIMSEAMTKYGDLEYKIDLIENLGKVYLALGNTEVSNNHFLLAIVIRRLNDWKISDALSSQIKYDFEGKDLNKIKHELEKRLKEQWQRDIRNKEAHNANEYTGVITNLSQPKESGVDLWIKDNEGIQYYSFVRKDNTVFNQLKKGAKVSFRVKPLPNRPMDKAIKIRLL